jgi:hypothetical protein
VQKGFCNSLDRAAERALPCCTGRHRNLNLVRRAKNGSTESLSRSSSFGHKLVDSLTGRTHIENGARKQMWDILNSKIGEVPFDLLLRKRLGWQHEQEWRLIAELSEGDKCGRVDSLGYPIYLFEIPPDAIHSITFGYRAPDSEIDSALQQIAHDGKWNHLQVSRRRRTANCFLEDRIR